MKKPFFKVSSCCTQCAGMHIAASSNFLCICSLLYVPILPRSRLPTFSGLSHLPQIHPSPNGSLSQCFLNSTCKYTTWDLFKMLIRSQYVWVEPGILSI